VLDELRPTARGLRHGGISPTELPQIFLLNLSGATFGESAMNFLEQLDECWREMFAMFGHG